MHRSWSSAVIIDFAFAMGYNAFIERITLYAPNFVSEGERYA